MSDPAVLIIESGAVQDTLAIGRAVGQCCVTGDIVALDGQLGAGKTQFVRGLAQGLGLDSRHVSSPTFVMVQEYEPEDAESDGPVLVHIDAYRLRNADDLSSIGWHGDGAELREGTVVAIEWAGLIRPMLGPDLIQIEIEHRPNGRTLSLTTHGDWRPRIAQLKALLGQTPD